MMQYVDSLKKIWVCGPPMMNETFDKTLEKLLYKLKLILILSRQWRTITDYYTDETLP